MPIGNLVLNLLAVDPTRTVSIRRRFISNLNRRFRKLKKAVIDFVSEKDALGLKDRTTLIVMAQPREFEFRTDPGKLQAFRDWLSQQIQADVLSGGDSQKPWVSEYIQSAYRRGVLNAYFSSKQVLLEEGLTQEQFLRSVFTNPETFNKIQILATRAFEDLKGVTAQMSTEMNRILAQGMLGGIHPDDIAREMAARIDSLTLSRALVIARTECLPGGTLVDGAAVRGAFRRWYDGLLVEVKTRNGRIFSTTPNHPMLTSDGWISSEGLNCSHYLVCNGRRNNFLLAGDPNVKGGPSSISQIFDSLSTIVRLERKFTHASDFHGDGIEGEVDILCSNRELLFGDFSTLGEKVVKSSFTKSGQFRSRFCQFCRRLLSVDEQQCLCERPHKTQFFKSPIDEALVNFVILRYALAGFPFPISKDDLFNVSLKGLIKLIGNSSLLPRQLLSLRRGSIHPGRSNHRRDPRFVSPFLLGDLPIVKPRQIEFDQVVSIELRDFSGHVYNLQTPIGYFTIAGGVYTGNTISAHAEGQLDAFEKLGIQELGIKAEWTTAGDNRVCEQCQGYEGEVFTVEEARGLIPLHPQCRCSWIPSEIQKGGD